MSDRAGASKFSLRKAVGRLRYRIPDLWESARKRFRDEDHFFDEVLQPSQKRIRQFTDNLQLGPRVLEVGTGSGIIARFCVKAGAKKVVAVDINPAAVERTRREVPQAEVFLSDLFSAVSGEFETIIFAAPWSEGEVKRDAHHAVFDQGVVIRFLKEAPQYLAPGGAIWLQYCDASEKNFALFKQALVDLAYSVQGEWSYKFYDVFAKKDASIILYKLVPTGAK
jgi:methylase of polypeptide subunit release factors